MRCKACDAPIPVSWRGVKDLDAPVLEDLCHHCLDAVRSSLLLVYPADNSIEENLQALGIRMPERDDEEASIEI